MKEIKQSIRKVITDYKEMDQGAKLVLIGNDLAKEFSLIEGETVYGQIVRITFHMPKRVAFFVK